MNKRQRKKVEDKLLIRLRKLHPGKGDFIFVEFDPDKIDIDIVLKYFDAIRTHLIILQTLLWYLMELL